MTDPTRVGGAHHSGAGVAGNWRERMAGRGRGNRRKRMAGEIGGKELQEIGGREWEIGGKEWQEIGGKGSIGWGVREVCDKLHHSRVHFRHS